MKKIVLIALLLVSSTRIGLAQVSGGAGAYGNNIDPAQLERAKRQPTAAELKDDGTSTFVEAGILMNVKADAYVAVFGVLQEGKTPAEANAGMDAKIRSFRESLKSLGVAQGDVFVDFIAQNRIYTYRIDETTTREEVAGFELKKNVSIRFKAKTLIDKLAFVAAQSQIFDLIKVDYVVQNAAAIQTRLQSQTMSLIKSKANTYRNLLGVKLSAPTQVTVNQPSIYYPVEQYDSYTAAESENITIPYDRSRIAVQNARKSRTTYFNPLSGEGFDRVINPNSIEPVVQFTTYLKMKYEAPQTQSNQAKTRLPRSTGADSTKARLR